MAVNNNTAPFSISGFTDPFLEYCAKHDSEALDKISQLNKTQNKKAHEEETIYFFETIIKYLRENQINIENLEDVFKENLFEKLLENLDEGNRTKLFYLLVQTDSKDLYSNPLYLFILKSLTSDKRREAMKFITSLLSQGSDNDFYVQINGQRGLHSKFTHALLEKIEADCRNKLSLRGRISFIIHKNTQILTNIFRNSINDLFPNRFESMLDSLITPTVVTALTLGSIGFTPIVSWTIGNIAGSVLSGIMYGSTIGNVSTRRIQTSTFSRIKFYIIGAVIGSGVYLATNRFIIGAVTLLAKGFFEENIALAEISPTVINLIYHFGISLFLRQDSVFHRMIIPSFARKITSFVQRLLS